MGIGLIDIDTKDCMMLRAHQSLNNKELSLRNKTMVDFYISVIKRYRKELRFISGEVRGMSRLRARPERKAPMIGSSPASCAR